MLWRQNVALSTPRTELEFPGGTGVTTASVVAAAAQVFVETELVTSLLDGSGSQGLLTLRMLCSGKRFQLPSNKGSEAIITASGRLDRPVASREEPLCRWQNENDKAMSVTHKHVGRATVDGISPSTVSNAVCKACSSVAAGLA